MSREITETDMSTYTQSFSGNSGEKIKRSILLKVSECLMFYTDDDEVIKLYKWDISYLYLPPYYLLTQ